MTRQLVTSREYKIMLRPERFAGEEKRLRKKAKKFWRDFEREIRPVVVDTDGDLDKMAKRREIRFYDTPSRRLFKNSYVFRERVDESGKREVTLKFRHPDRYLAQARDLNARASDGGTIKFEEDIKPEFQVLYSFSGKQIVRSGKKLNRMDDPAGLYPDLAKRLDEFDEREPIRVVGETKTASGRVPFTANEVVLEGADFRIAASPKVEAECGLIVWYDRNGDPTLPVVVEFSFRYGNRREAFGGEAAKRAFDVFRMLQGKALAKWVDRKSKTKTAYVYGL
jgi:hypothetical protein